MWSNTPRHNRLLVLLAVIAACGQGGGSDTTFAATTRTTTAPVTTSAPSTTSSVVEQVVVVFFGIESPVTCSKVAGYERFIPPDADPIRAAFEELLEGPSEEEASDEVWSWFSEATAGMLRDVSLTDDRLTVDFADFSAVIPNASSSCGSAALLAQLTATALQFGQVNHVAYSFEGSCQTFGEFLQMGCVEITRSAWPPPDASEEEGFEAGAPTLVPPQPLPGSDGAAGSGCNPSPGPLPDGAWFGMIISANPDSVEFDLACFFFGDNANEAAAEDGVEEIPVPNDYYIRNRLPNLRTLPVASDAVVHTLGASIEDFETVGWEQWPVSPSFLQCPGESCLTWIYVNGGLVTEVVEQYTP